jgi:shikimate kinase
VNSADERHIALVGLSGSGKSTLAPVLASRLGSRHVVDLDREVEERFGESVAEIFRLRGEAAFRDAEADALATALSGPPAVIATGGGVVLDAENRRALVSGAFVVWLRAHPDHLEQRLSGPTEARPLLEGDRAFALARLSEERAALYGAVADLVIDVEGLDASDLAVEVVRAIG